MQPALQVLARWNALPKNLRTASIVAAAAIVATAAFASVAAHAPRAALFASPLHPEQLSEVEERLAGWNVPFTPVADNVIVDEKRRADLLLRLSLAGTPHAHIEDSAEALAGVGALTPQAVVDAQARAGLAGDIEAGLRGIEGVDDARVIVAPAKAAEFADETARDASASVRVRLREGARLSAAAVAGIRAFVAAGVPGLDPSRVTILDDRGISLGDGDVADDSAELQRSLQSALDEAFGAGTTIVRVHAEYRRDRTTTRDVRAEPLANAPVARTSHDESYDDGNKRYRRSDSDERRGSDVRESLSETPAGQLQRVATAVFLDRSQAAVLANVRDLAAAAVAFDARRGDTLSIEAVDFHRVPASHKDAWWLAYGAVVPLLPAMAIAVALVLAARVLAPVLGAVLRAWIERAGIAAKGREVAGLSPSRVRSALAHEPPYAAAAVISALPASTAAAVLDLYPAHEREAIVRRMQRRQGPLLGDAEELLNRYA